MPDYLYPDKYNFFYIWGELYTTKLPTMSPKSSPGVKPLPKKLEKALLECYKREQQHIEPVVNCTTHTTFELIERGMLSAKTFMRRKKSLFGFYVTQVGIDYLSKLESITVI